MNCRAEDREKPDGFCREFFLDNSGLDGDRPCMERSGEERVGGGSRQALVQELKRRGPSTVPELAGATGLNVETVRHHVRTLSGRGLVARTGTRRSGPGRPEVEYGLTREAEALFPRREGELLRELVQYLARIEGGPAPR